MRNNGRSDNEEWSRWDRSVMHGPPDRKGPPVATVIVEGSGVVIDIDPLVLYSFEHMIRNRNAMRLQPDC